MSKKTSKQPFFCETQCSDSGDENDDYIDQLIKKKGAEALNHLLKDDNEYFESELEKNEIIQLRDSLMTPL